MITESLAGKRVLVTGATGFLGQMLLERLVSWCPETHVTVLIRARGAQSGRDRLTELLTQPVFGRLRDRVGDEGIEQLLSERVDVIEGGLGEHLPSLPDDLAVVFHCAATVAFDPPIDEAFQTNLVGTTSLYEAVRATGSDTHLVHVSTAYVAGMRKGVVPEATLDHHVDWRAELDAAMAARQQVERSSRRPEVLDRLVAQAAKEHGRAGPQTVSEDAEQRRRDWVSERLVEYGRARAQSLGWPDVYTFTKALGERAAEEIAGDLPLSIVRPSIVESALAEPYPGWIEGFKMAEPIILAYGRGAIPDFPGIPEGIVDIIPVDLVANAMLAVAVTRPEDGRGYYHVSSGARNPLSFKRLYELVREYFERDPLAERDRGEVPLPTWEFPGRTRVERLLRTGERLVDAADKAVTALPRSSKVRDWVRSVDRQRSKLEFVRRYADLYGAYTEAEVIYTDDRARALYESLPDDDRDRFGFDAATLDWRHYLQDVHCPAVTAVLRVHPPKRDRRRAEVGPAGDGVAAVFDLEGTILSSNVIESYLWLRLGELPHADWPTELASVLRGLPRYLVAERRDRGEFLRAFYRRYEGASVEGIAQLVDEHVAELLFQRAAPEALRQIRRHRAAGHRTILITGALDCFVEPLHPLFDAVVAAQLGVRDGRYTGILSQPPLVGEARAAWLRRYAAHEGLDLDSSYAYGDSHSDLPLLAAVGNPVAVNPDQGLFRAARRRKWPVEEWEAVDPAPRTALPGRRRAGTDGGPVEARSDRRVLRSGELAG